MPARKSSSRSTARKSSAKKSSARTGTRRTSTATKRTASRRKSNVPPAARRAGNSKLNTSQRLSRAMERRGFEALAYEK